jgi:branched-chain amino acid transport system permease protein
MKQQTWLDGRVQNRSGSVTPLGDRLHLCSKVNAGRLIRRERMAQILINGVITGLTSSLLAVAFSVVYLPTRVFHVASGGIYVAAPMIAWACLQRHWSAYLALAVTLLVGIALSLACELLNHGPLERKHASSGVHLVSSLGIYILVVQAVAMIWGNETKVLRTGVDAVLRIGEIAITRAQIVAALVAITLLVLFYLWLRFTGLGLRFRALASNPAETALRGYNIRRLRLIAFGLSGLLVATSSLVVSLDLGFSPQGGLSALLLAVVAVIIGGRETFLGPALGGLILGVIRSCAVWFLSSRWQEAVTFLLLALFLFVLPNGLLGRENRMEAQT